MKIGWKILGGLAIAALLTIGRGVASADTKPFVWIEGESAIKSSLVQNSWLKGDNPKLLSGGDMFAAINKRSDLPSPAFILYKFDVPADGSYFFYMRHGYTGHMGEARYRFVKLGDDGKPVAKPGPEDGWMNIDWDTPIIDSKVIGQYRTIEWTKHDPATLTKGSYFLDYQVTGPNKAHTEADPLIWTSIDAICLTQAPFTPSGDTKPGETPSAGGGAGGGGSYY